MMDSNRHVRQRFAMLRECSTKDVPMLDIVGASFLVTQPTIFGAVNDEYVQRELEWYDLRSLTVDDFPGGAPKIWKQVAGEGGRINSNYGYLLYHDENGAQYDHVRDELRRDPNSRRAVAVYTRPSIHTEQDIYGMQDFICTNAVHYRVVYGALVAVVQMRSNDAIFGFRNDYAWQLKVQQRLARDLDISVGEMIWQAASLHIYPRHYHLVDKYIETGEYTQSLRG